MVLLPRRTRSPILVLATLYRTPVLADRRTDRGRYFLRSSLAAGATINVESQHLESLRNLSMTNETQQTETTSRAALLEVHSISVCVRTKLNARGRGAVKIRDGCGVSLCEI
jgi:hypothetical protein